jgi:hypothetical protein
MDNIQPIFRRKLLSTFDTLQGYSLADHMTSEVMENAGKKKKKRNWKNNQRCD